MISIIIPALNEEKYLPLLLESIKNQKIDSFGFVQDKDYEIILADAGSKDKTLEIAKRYGCIITSGGLPGKGRNEGSKIAKGEDLFFLDADAILPQDFFEKFFTELAGKKLEIAGFRLIPLPKRKMSSFLLDTFYNNPAIVLEHILPHAAMGIFIKRDIFRNLGGFDENIKLAEDIYMVRQAVKLFKAKFGILKTTEIFVSDRRFKTDGWLSTGVKYLLCELHMMFIGPVKSDIFKYKFDHHKNENKKI